MTLFLTQQGFAYVDYYNGGYENADSLQSLVTTGANSIEAAFEYGIDPQNDTVYADSNYTDSLTAIGATIKEATADGLSVMVRPLIDFLNPSYLTGTPYGVGDWRAYFNPGAAGSAGANAFFASYKTMLLQYAQVGVANGATSLCIGTEIDQLTGPAYKSYWDGIISTLRAEYPTLKLTYAADWDDDQSPWTQGGSGLAAGTGNLATQVSFASELDDIGIDNYAPISDAANPTLSQLIAGWTQTPTDATTRAVTGGQSLIAYFESVAAAAGKPLLFTELGYESATDAASSPAGSSTNAYDPSLQSLLYQAFFEAWRTSGDASLTGVYFWNWDPNAAEVGPGNGANFSPQGEPAQTEVTQAFSTSDKLDLTQVFGPQSTLEINLTTSGSVVKVFDNVSGGETEVDIPGYQIGAAQILTGETDTPYVLELLSGDVARDLSVAGAGDVIRIESGASATGTVLTSNAGAVVFGATIGATVVGGAVEHVLASGTTTGTAVSGGGDQLVSSGGVADATRVLSGGRQYVLAGGLASAAVVSAGGAQVVRAAGTARGTVISGGGEEVVSSGGVASATRILSGGKAAIYSGGAAVGAAISGGGVEYVLAGGTTTGARVSGGGKELISSGGVASGTQVEAGGLAYIRSGGAAVGPTIASGGIETIYAGGTARGLGLLSGGELVDDGQVLISGAGTLAGTLKGSGAVVEAGGDDLVLSGADAHFAGMAVISAGAIELATAAALGTGFVEFAAPAGGSAVLQIDAADTPKPGGTFANVISGFNGAGEAIDLRGVAYVSGASATVSGSTLVLRDGGKAYKFQLAGVLAGAYSVLSDGHGGVLIDPQAVPKAVDPEALAFAHAIAAFAPPAGANAAMASSPSPAAPPPFAHAIGSGAAAYR